MVPSAPVNGATPINYRMKVKYQLCFVVTRFNLLYTAVQIKNVLKSTSVIKVVSMKNTDN